MTITGETWTIRLTAEEYAAWDKYAETHPWLFQGRGSYEGIVRMFLSHLRRGCDLNAVFERNQNQEAVEQ